MSDTDSEIRRLFETIKSNADHIIEISSNLHIFYDAKTTRTLAHRIKELTTELESHIVTTIDLEEK